jgi:hypothetical protein
VGVIVNQCVIWPEHPQYLVKHTVQDRVCSLSSVTPQTSARSKLRFVAHAGNPLYEKERERIMGQRAKRTARLALGAARRNRALAVAYSLSIAASYLIIVADSMHAY